MSDDQECITDTVFSKYMTKKQIVSINNIASISQPEITNCKDVRDSRC